jgi:ATP-dependent DNA helicase RecG
MSKDRAIKLIEQQEGIHLEFKKAENSLPANLFETICAMLNREGGRYIFRR